MSDPVPHTDDAPEPSASVELVLMLAEAFVAATTPRQGVTFVCELTEMVRLHDEEAEVVRLAQNAPAKIRARRQAFAMLRRALPLFMKRLGVEDDT